MQHLYVSLTVYQLQQEAPRPKRVTCPQEVSTFIHLHDMDVSNQTDVHKLKKNGRRCTVLMQSHSQQTSDYYY